jgi:hypothetical protein
LQPRDGRESGVPLTILQRCVVPRWFVTPDVELSSALTARHVAHPQERQQAPKAGSGTSAPELSVHAALPPPAVREIDEPQARSAARNGAAIGAGERFDFC